MKRLSAFSNRHPLLSFFFGWLVLLAIIIACVPVGDPLGQAVHVVSGRVT